MSTMCPPLCVTDASNSFDQTGDQKPFFLDDCIMDAYNSLDERVKMCETCDTSGTTAVTLAIEKLADGRTLVTCAWVGDSRMIMLEDGKVVDATEDHKPDNPKERERIDEVKINSFVGTFRLTENGRCSPLQLFSGSGGGCTAMTRSIGDKGKARSLISTPQLKKWVIEPGRFVQFILATDGVWDVVQNQCAAQLSAKHSDPFSISKTIAGQALEARLAKCLRQDDITVMTVDLNGGILRGSKSCSADCSVM